jgi:dTMP kinase
MFISFEGGEGSGKTTQIQLLAQSLTAQGRSVCVTREPGGTAEAEAIRTLFVTNSALKWDMQEQCLLLFAARRSHIRQVINPALQRGEIVICDRFTDSTYAYQAYGLGLDTAFIDTIDALTTKSLRPDLTFFLDIDPSAGLLRAKSRETTQNSGEDRFENLNLDFHTRLYKGFQTMAAAQPERIKIIDANGAIEDVHQRIMEHINNAL